jgi:hypothetical protein
VPSRVTQFFVRVRVRVILQPHFALCKPLTYNGVSRVLIRGRHESSFHVPIFILRPIGPTQPTLRDAFSLVQSLYGFTIEMEIDMIGTFFPEDSYFRELMWETAAGCSTRGVMLTTARLLINAIDDELACDLVPKARKKRYSVLRTELEQKILCAPGRRGHLVPFASSELRPQLESGKTRSAKILPFKRHSYSQTPETL